MYLILQVHLQMPRLLSLASREYKLCQRLNGKGLQRYASAAPDASTVPVDGDASCPVLDDGVVATAGGIARLLFEVWPSRVGRPGGIVRTLSTRLLSQMYFDMFTHKQYVNVG